MKRDPDLVREILLRLEESDPTNGVDIAIEGYTDTQVAYHIMLLNEAGLLIASDASPHGGISWIPRRLTWSGHEFLDAARSATVWASAKKMIAERVGSVSFEVLKAVLVQVAKGALGLP